VIQFRTENARVLPVFGPDALAISPRVGHLHVTLDDAPWVMGHTSGQELIFSGLPPGPHKVLVELANPNHKVQVGEVVKFEVPRRSPMQPEPKAEEKQPPAGEAQPPAKLIVDPPLPGPLSRGVTFIRYRAENVQILPVFGPAAAAVSPRIGHIHVTLDDAPWHWADASGGPVIVSYLPPGPHKILIELVDANHKVLTQKVVKVEIR
jgi:hypothetical protein